MRSDTGIDVLTGEMVGVDMLHGVKIVVVVAVVMVLEFSVLIAYVSDVLTGVIICCVSDIGVDVLTDMNIVFLTAPIEERAIPSCWSKFDCRPMDASDRDSILQVWMPAYQV